MFVVNIDQEDSRRSQDRIPAALQSLAHSVASPHLAFERTVGDEVQGVIASGADVVAACRALAATGAWHVGIGIGGVEEPLPSSTRAARGQAFIAARSAVEAAKARTPSVRVCGVEGLASPDLADADVALALLASLWRQRTDAGWTAVRAIEAARAEEQKTPMGTVAEKLGISHQALSQRLRTAAWDLEMESMPAVARLLDRADVQAVDAS